MRHEVHTPPPSPRVGDEMSDAELEAVAGGKSALPHLPPITTIDPFPPRPAGLAFRPTPAAVPAVNTRGGCAGGVCRPG